MTYTPTGRPPGRPPRQAEAAVIDADTPRQAEGHAKRRRRGDLDETRNRKLYVPEHVKDPAYEYRWINDTDGGRLTSKTKFDDWDIVTEAEMRGEVEATAGVGTQVKRPVGGNNEFAYLCKKPRDLAEADRRKARVPLDEMEEQLKRGPLASGDGLKPSESYVPGGKNEIRRGA